MKDLFLRSFFFVVYFVYGVICDIPNDTGWHLAGDKVAALARRIFQIPHEDTGRDLEVNIAGNLQYDTWQMSNGQKSFPEVSQVYSWQKRSRAFPETDVFQSGWQMYSIVKNDMGKYSWWSLNNGRFNGLLSPESMRRGLANNADQNDPSWSYIRARFDSLTGDCSHKMHYQHPYLIVICYNNDAIHDTLNQPMVYDYYLHINRPAADGGPDLTNTNGDPATTWPISGQSYMNSTDIDTNGVDAPPAYALGNGPLSVDFNHRVHTTSIYAQRNPDAGELLTSNANKYQYWTVTWNGPYQG